MASIKPRFGLTAGWADGENGWGPSLNNDLCKIDRLLWIGAQSKTATVPTVASSGDQWIDPITGSICTYTVSWEKDAPVKGMISVVCDANGGQGDLCFYDGSAWQSFTTIVGNNIVLTTTSLVNTIMTNPGDIYQIFNSAGTPAGAPPSPGFPIACNTASGEVYVYDYATGTWKVTSNSSITGAFCKVPKGDSAGFIDVSWIDPADIVAIVNANANLISLTIDKADINPADLTITKTPNKILCTDALGCISGNLVAPGTLSVAKADILAADVTDVFTGTGGQIVCTNATGMIDGSLIQDGSLRKADLNTTDLTSSVKSPNKFICTNAAGCLDAALLPPIPATALPPITKAMIQTADVATSGSLTAANAGDLLCLGPTGFIKKLDIDPVDKTQIFTQGAGNKVVCTDANGEVDPELVNSVPDYATDAAFVAAIGRPVRDGDRYYNTTEKRWKYYHSGAGLWYWNSSGLHYTAASATLGATVPATTLTRVNFDSVTTDNTTAWLGGASAITPGAGWAYTSKRSTVYEIHLRLALQLASNSDNYYAIALIYRNGVEIARTNQGRQTFLVAGGNLAFMEEDITLGLALGDVIHVEVFTSDPLGGILSTYYAYNRILIVEDQ